MLRIGAITLLALLPIALAAQATGDKDTDKTFKVEGKLTDDDPRDKSTKTASNVHKYPMKAGSNYVIRMVSDEVDAFLRLETAKGEEVAENDDESPGSFNAKIIYRCKKDGDYKIITTCFGQPVDPKLKLTGKYTLTVRQVAKEDLAKEFGKLRVSPQHQELLGKPAPEVLGEFAINGKVKKLSELKGKVVLLDFWAVWCGPCIATFPHLREWHKDYGKDGLVILGATTYYEKFGFDKGSGRLTRPEEALKPGEEHVMIGEFAKHYKLHHELLVLSKDDWKKASDDFAIQGIPTVALIDRRGDVRLICVGSGDANAYALETEIEKLLAEKETPK
jgi:thiol-disulfide isomerase/thioredoxin